MRAMLLGYNTNGFAHHSLGDTIEILQEIGYRSIAITLERENLNPPYRSGVADCVDRIAPLIAGSGLRVMIETGSRFLLDPRRKHQPTLLSTSPAQREQRAEFLRAACEVAASLSADGVSLWSGTPDGDADEDELFDMLSSGLNDILGLAETLGVRLCFEPEPGMFIDTMARFERLYESVNHPLLGLTLDVGHVHCLGDGDPQMHIRRWRDKLWNVHIEDMHRGSHEHLMFGDGEVDFKRVFGSLREVNYSGPVHVELPRHSHDAVETARRAFVFLQRYVQSMDEPTSG